MKSISRKAVTMFAQEASRCPLNLTSDEIVPLISTPKTEPMIVPTPPVRSVPPMTAEDRRARTPEAASS